MLDTRQLNLGPDIGHQRRGPQERGEFSYRALPLVRGAAVDHQNKIMPPAKASLELRLAGLFTGRGLEKGCSIGVEIEFSVGKYSKKHRNHRGQSQQALRVLPADLEVAS